MGLIPLSKNNEELDSRTTEEFWDFEEVGGGGGGRDSLSA